MNSPSGKMNLVAHYRALVDDGAIKEDSAQNLVVEKLSLLANRLGRDGEKPRGFASALFGWGREKIQQERLKGLYIYGAVGRGKSMLMQLFVDAVGSLAWRVHFHEFMQFVQKELTEIRKGKASEPLDVVAEQIAKRTQVLCLDEMQIENIADAMIVGRLFEGLFERGVVLVTTSNRPPQDLYKNGLNRARFLPFIDILSANCDVVSLDGPIDYRLGSSEAGRLFVSDQQALPEIWSFARGKEIRFDLPLAGRVWTLEHVKPDAVFLEFADACETPRGAQDYRALAECFTRIFINHVPALDASRTSAAARFITLIDILYEAHTELYLETDVPLSQIHQDEATKFAFERTLSRLAEMMGGNWNNPKSKQA